MTGPSRYLLETLWEDGEFVLSRGVREGEPSPVLVLAPASAQPAPGSLARLERPGARDRRAARGLRPGRGPGHTELVLVSGYPGIGMSSVVRLTLRNPTNEPNDEYIYKYICKLSC
jgi:hypothetical protein